MSSIVKIARIVPSASIVCQFLVFFLNGRSLRSHGPGEVYRQITYVCVGTFEMVGQCLRAVAENVDGPNV